MMTRLLAASAALLLVSANPASAQSVVSQLAQSMQSLVGQKYEGDIVVSTIAAEDKTLVITINAQSGWDNMSPVSITNAFLVGFCGSPNGAEYFKTNWLRVDMLDHGANLKHGTPVNRCPAAGTQ